jgi:hypothetical protein
MSRFPFADTRTGRQKKRRSAGILGAVTKQPKRPRDPNQLAKRIVDIATGQVEDREPTPEEEGKDPAAVALGQKGGAARARSTTPEKRSEIAKKAARSRWKGQK